MPTPRFGIPFFLSLALTGGGCTMMVDAPGPAPENLQPRPKYSIGETLLAPPAPPQGQVTFYTQPNFHGDSFTVEAGSDLDRLDAWDNDISSFRIEGPVTVMVFSETRYRGEAFSTASSSADLIAESRGRTLGANWDNVISSLRVVPARNANYSDIYRDNNPLDPPRYDRRQAESIVRRAYHDVFGREPDPAGMATYSQRILVGVLTEEALRHQLQSSPEFERTDHAAFVAQAYREILHREPDTAGLAHYRDLMVNSGWTETQVRAALLRSDEAMRLSAKPAVVTPPAKPPVAPPATPPATTPPPADPATTPPATPPDNQPVAPGPRTAEPTFSPRVGGNVKEP